MCSCRFSTKRRELFFCIMNKKYNGKKQMLTLHIKGFIFKIGMGIPTKYIFRRNSRSVKQFIV